jgi:hypothetical protein
VSPGAGWIATSRAVTMTARPSNAADSAAETVKLKAHGNKLGTLRCSANHTLCCPPTQYRFGLWNTVLLFPQRFLMKLSLLN